MSQPQEFGIKIDELTSLQGDVAVITGGASGIGLATTKLLLEKGCVVVAGDLNSPPISHDNLIFRKTNVASWQDLSALFTIAHERGGRIDHVFANAGISESAGSTYLIESFGPGGELQEPDHTITDVNVTGMTNTCYLALHYMRKQESGGSIVVTSSITGFQVFRSTQYTMSKHAVIGFMRGLVSNLKAPNMPPIRINVVSPSWTLTGLLSKEQADVIGIPAQRPEEVADAVVLLMADHSRQGQNIYISGGKFREIEHSVFMPAVDNIMRDEVKPDEYLDKFMEVLA